MRRLIVGVGLCAAVLAGCGGDPADPPAGGSASAKADAFCAMDGLAAPLRTTTVVIDAQSLVASPAENFRTANPALVALVMGIGDPARAIETGAVAPRERITLLLGDPASGSLRQLFTGCIPGIGATELAARKTAGEDGAFDRYMGSDIASQLDKAGADFRKTLLVALVGARAGGKAVAADRFDGSALARLVREIGPGSAAEPGVRRLILFVDPGRSLGEGFASHEQARTAGFAAGERIGANLGRSEVHVALAGRPVGEQDKAFLDAFLLQSGGDLRRIGVFSPDGLSPPPTRIHQFAGELPLAPGVDNPMTLRLAATGAGELVNSWISYSGVKGLRATPVAGQYRCDEEERCTLRGDPNGVLGQRWRTTPGSAPQMLPGGPFGGLRMIEATVRGGRLSGRIYDPVIFVGAAGDLKFEAKRSDSSREEPAS